MAQIIIGSSEISSVLDLVEQILPGVNLTSAKKMIEGIELTSQTTIKKVLDSKETVELSLTINAD